MVFDPLHYLPVIERKTGALDQAAPLAGWELPDAFATLRRLMEARSGRAGRREYVQVLRLLRDVRHTRRACGGPACPSPGRHRLRCGQAPGAVPGREAPAQARPRRLSVPAQGQRRQDLRGELPVPDVEVRAMNDTPQILLEHRLKTLKLPTFLREYEKVARRGPHHLESSLRRVDRDVRNRAPDRGAARPTDPSRSYPGTERPELPPQPDLTNLAAGDTCVGSTPTKGGGDQVQSRETSSRASAPIAEA